MSGEGGYLKMDSKKIKDVLRHHSELTQQIHKQVLEIREKLDEVQQQTIEMASYPKIDLSQEGGGRGTHKDLADVYLRYTGGDSSCDCYGKCYNDNFKRIG